MITEEMQTVADRVDAEGSIEYTFIYYSKFAAIKDKKFHKLRKKYIKAHKKLSGYINARSVGEDDDNS